MAHQVWTFSTGVLRGHEAAPIVAENTMFVATPFLNILYAIDLTQPGGTLKWKYEPGRSHRASGASVAGQWWDGSPTT